MSEKDSPHSRPVEELEPVSPSPEEMTAPERAPHSLPIEATRPAADVGLAGSGDPAMPPRRTWGRRLVAAGLGLAVSGAAAALLETVVSDALAGNDWTSWIIAVGLGLGVAGVLLGLVREWLALEGLDGLRAARIKAENAEDDPALARSALDQLRRFYRHRPDLEWGWAKLDEERRAGLDGVTLLQLADQFVLSPLDRRAERIAISAVRRAAAVAAMSPFALADMAFTLVIVATMLRRMLRLYGGRPGLLATLKLLRMSIAYVLASGALEFADDTIGDLLGVGIASRLSRRVGTGLVTGLLAARIAVAAMNLVRPFPPHRPLPTARGLLARATIDIRAREE